MCCWVLAAALAAAGHANASGVASPPSVPAEAYLLVDHVTGSVLAEANADRPLPPASLTKLMTAYVVFDALRNGRIAPDDRVLVSEKAWRTGGSRMFIEVGTEVAVADLLHGLIVQSGNDAAVALAEHVAGSEEAFVAMMNERAAALGMASTTFRNATGLPAAGHLTTARDLAVLARALVDDFPEYHSLYAEREFTYNGIRQYNRNRLLRRDPSVDGLKTGYTSRAGYCIVVTAAREGRRLVAVVLGADSSRARRSAAQSLLDYGFSAFETYKLFAKGEPIGAARVWKGVADSAAVGLTQDVYVTIPRGAYGALSAVMQLPAALVAPVQSNVEIGEVSVSLDGEPLLTAPLVVLDAVSVGGLWTRVKHALLMRLEDDE
ncbi:MAG TPA: D-alanyl-D-alanine carboxypeptidase family protein [Gammaproteobacteria bacterium]